MNKNWKDYLLSKGAQLSKLNAESGKTLFHFNHETSGQQKTENSNIICDLSHFSLLVIAGEDAAEFMQGQFTNDVKKVNAESSQISGFCNNKGRLIANFQLFQYQQNYFLSLKSDLVEDSIKHLQNYILRARVAVQDVSEQLIHLGLSGDNAMELLSPFIKDISTEIDSVSHNENYIAIRVAGLKPRYEIFCSIEHAKTLWEKITEQADATSSTNWDYLNIQAGIAFIDKNSSSEFVPQMLNMDLINGVSFSKGCFTGQEIVARMHYLGKLKKRCFKVHIETEDKPVSGDKLFAENAKAGLNTGSIVLAEKNPESGYDALAVIQIADIESNLFLNDADGPVVTVKQLPYSFESSENDGE